MGSSSQRLAGEWFTSTHWTEIHAVRTDTPERRRALLESLARRYWRPVYHFLRAQGQADADARDTTQAFFAEVILGRDLFGQADPQKGRFRPYLLRCLKNFVREVYRREHAGCRAPDRGVISIEHGFGSEAPRYEPIAPDASPENVYHRQWAASLLEQVIDRLAADCQTANLQPHYRIFHERVVRPALEGTPPAPLETLAARYGLTSKQAANRGETIRRRFRQLLLDEVRTTVGDQAEAEDELQCLLLELRP